MEKKRKHKKKKVREKKEKIKESVLLITVVPIAKASTIVKDAFMPVARPLDRCQPFCFPTVDYVAQSN